MPVWELNLLLQQLGEYLPHILYGADGAHAANEQRNQASGFDDLVSQPVGGC